MPDIALHRPHQLGLKRAREIAWKWAEDAEAKFGMECTVEEGDDEDVVHFTRSGVNGTLLVRSDTFELAAKLSFLLGAFQKTIEGEIEKNLDGLLAAEHKRVKALLDGIQLAHKTAVAADREFVRGRADGLVNLSLALSRRATAEAAGQGV